MKTKLKVWQYVAIILFLCFAYGAGRFFFAQFLVGMISNDDVRWDHDIFSRVFVSNFDGPTRWAFFLGSDEMDMLLLDVLTDKDRREAAHVILALRHDPSMASVWFQTELYEEVFEDPDGSTNLRKRWAAILYR